jgi:hypothetical protein
MSERQSAIQIDFYEAIMDGSSPSQIPPHKERLASVVMSAPALIEVCSAGYPPIEEIVKPSGATPTDDFDDADSAGPANDANAIH